jgi:hypothetical protein
VQTAGRIAPGFMHSVDGTTWSIADENQDFFDASVHSPDGDNYMIFSQPSIVERGNQLLFYYSYINRNHSDDAAFSEPYDFEGDIHIASMRRDGFTSLDAYGEETGVWITNQIQISSGMNQITLNAIIDGGVSLELLDADTLEVINGFTRSDFLELLAGDYYDAQLRWTDANLADLTGQNVRLKFYLDDASLYSFQFTAVPEPSSAGFLTFALLVATCRRRQLL